MEGTLRISNSEIQSKEFPAAKIQLPSFQGGGCRRGENFCERQRRVTDGIFLIAQIMFFSQFWLDYDHEPIFRKVSKSEFLGFSIITMKYTIDKA
jgi:hypothetical protein